MSDIIDKVKEKAKEAKDSVLKNTKDIGDNYNKDNTQREGVDSRYETASATEQYNTTSSSTTEDSIRNTSTGTKENSGSAGILDWDTIIHKGVRTKDMEPVGNVTAVTGTSIIITSEGARDEFNVPKEQVEAFNGAEVILNSTLDGFKQFKVQVPK